MIIKKTGNKKNYISRKNAINHGVIHILIKLVNIPVLQYIVLLRGLMLAFVEFKINGN